MAECQWEVKAVLKSSAGSKVDDGQVEQEDIAPEEEDQDDASDPEEMLRPAERIGRERGRKKFLERVQRSVPPVVTMRLIMTYFCLRQYFSGCQNLSFGIDASRIGLLNRMLGLICRPDGFAGWLPPQATTSNHIQMYHRPFFWALGGQSKHSLGPTWSRQRRWLGSAKVIWRRRGRSSWQSSARDDEETRAKIRKRKLHRTKAYEWLLAVSHMLVAPRRRRLRIMFRCTIGEPDA